MKSLSVAITTEGGNDRWTETYWSKNEGQIIWETCNSKASIDVLYRQAAEWKKYFKRI